MQKKTIKEAVLQSLEDLKKPSTKTKIYNHIRDKEYFIFGGRTPSGTVSSILGNFIKYGDSRVKRIKRDNVWAYYLVKYEEEIEEEIIPVDYEKDCSSKKPNTSETFRERDLHKLLNSYLNSKSDTQVYSKTIYHEKSKFSKEPNQTWTNPDMVSVKFLNLKTKTSRKFIKAINQINSFELSSYELKKEINNDSELKKHFFQAVSNSSWANFGYLVVFEYSDNLSDEMERLNQSFGIGIIKLNSNPFQSKVLFAAKYKELDFKTIDKICNMNNDFNQFIEKIEKLLTSEERHYTNTENELIEFCDEYFENDAAIKKYCEEKNIPFE